MKNKVLFSLIWMLILVGLQNGLLNIIMYGFAPFTGVSDSTRVISQANNLVRQGTIFDSYEFTRLGQSKTDHPPGYAIYYSVLNLLVFQDHEYSSFLFLLSFNLIYYFLITILGFLLFKKFGALIFLLFSVYSVYPSVTINDNSSLSPGVKTLFLDLNGTNTDLLFITLFIILLVKFFKTKTQSEKYIALLFITNITHGLSHASRFFALDVTFLISCLFLAFAYSFKGKISVRNQLFELCLIPLISMLIVYMVYYYPNLARQESEYFDSELFKVLPKGIDLFDTLIISIFFLVMSISILIYLLYYPIVDRTKSVIIGKTWMAQFNRLALPLSLFFTIALISYTHTYNVNLYLQDPFYLQIFSNIFNPFYFPIIFLNLFLWFSIIVYSYPKSTNFTNLFISTFITINFLFFIFSLIADIHPTRMHIIIYFKSLIFTSVALIIFNYIDSLKWIKSLLTKKLITYSLLVVVCMSQFSLILISFIGNAPVVSDIQIYESRPKETPLTENVIISSNLIDFLEVHIVDEEYVLTSPHSQEMLGAIFSYRIIEEDLIRFYIKDYDVNDYFSKFNASYFVLINADINTPESDISVLDVGKWDSNSNLELIYINSLGERVYKYKE